MKTQYIYKNPNGDLFYVNNNGKEFLLTVSCSPLDGGSYDLIIALEIDPKAENFLSSATVNSKYFFGASFVEDYMKGEDKFFLDSCKEFLDDQSK